MCSTIMKLDVTYTTERYTAEVDAKAYILTMSEENVLQIPSAAVCSDSEGEYVYVYSQLSVYYAIILSGHYRLKRLLKRFILISGRRQRK